MNKLIKKSLIVLFVLTLLVGCSAKSNEEKVLKIYTHMGQFVLGEEKKDDKGNTYRDAETAYLLEVA